MTEGDLRNYMELAEQRRVELERVKAALENEARLRIKDCDDRNAYKRKSDISLAALRTICDIGETRDVEVARAAIAEIEGEA